MGGWVCAAKAFPQAKPLREGRGGNAGAKMRGRERTGARTGGSTGTRIRESEDRANSERLRSLRDRCARCGKKNTKNIQSVYFTAKKQSTQRFATKNLASSLSFWRCT